MSVRRVALLVLFVGPAVAQAQPSIPRDPWVPEAVITKRASVSSSESPTRGAALKAQVERKLRASFDAADVDGQGSVTLEQARAAGLGLVVREFQRIDAESRGRITFEDYKRFLRTQGANL